MMTSLYKFKGVQISAQYLAHTETTGIADAFY